jgi:hypothetical protein
MVRDVPARAGIRRSGEVKIGWIEVRDARRSGQTRLRLLCYVECSLTKVTLKSFLWMESRSAGAIPLGGAAAEDEESESGARVKTAVSMIVRLGERGKRIC